MARTPVHPRALTVALVLLATADCLISMYGVGLAGVREMNVLVVAAYSVVGLLAFPLSYIAFYGVLFGVPYLTPWPRRTFVAVGVPFAFWAAITVVHNIRLVT